MIIDGRKISEKILDEVKQEINKKQLKLAVILVGQNEASKVYIEKKKEACQKVGIDFELFNFPVDVLQRDLEEKIKSIDAAGIVVQLPLPKTINTEEALKLIPKEKDVEGFVSEINSPVVCAIEQIFKYYKISLENKEILIIGKGRLIGKPVSKWLKNQNINFNIIDKSEKNISFFTQKADIIISGTGVPELIKKDMVKEGVIIIDAGTFKKDGKTVGDVDFENICLKAKYITPCIGGIGPITVACLLCNLLKLNKEQDK